MKLFNGKPFKPSKQDLDDMETVKQNLEILKAAMPAEISEAHSHAYGNREEINNSKLCGCFYCLSTFEPKEVEWSGADGELAICPECQIDSVLGDASGYQLTPEFLGTMKRYWFDS